MTSLSAPDQHLTPSRPECFRAGGLSEENIASKGKVNNGTNNKERN